MRTTPASLITPTIRKPIDAFERHLLAAAKITRLFKEKGWAITIVGGSALEFYTEGQYVSGDIDTCRNVGQKPIPPTVERDVMFKAGAVSTGTRRQWKIGQGNDAIFIDLLGEIETAKNPAFRTLQTPEGPVQLMPAEDVLVERVFIADTDRKKYPEAKELDSEKAAKKMAAAAISMGQNFDWDKAIMLAKSRDYDVEKPLRTIIHELSHKPKLPPTGHGDYGS